MKVAARKMADAFRAAAERHSERQGPGRWRATVTRWASADDFELDLHGSDLTLDEQDVTLGQTVRRYDADTGIDEGDALILVELDEGDFVAVDVESDTEAP